MLLDIAQSLSVSTTGTAPASPGPLPLVLFYGFAAIVVGGGLATAWARNIVRQAVGLLFCLAGMSGLYLLLSAEFLAAVQLVVYVGGTLILIIFGVMLTGKSPQMRYAPKKREVLWALSLGVVVVSGLISLLVRTTWTHQLAAAGIVGGLPGPEGVDYSVKYLGRQLLDPQGFLAPFELVSIVLLAVMIGAAYLAKARKAAPPRPGVV